ncbi:MAG: nuclear transport factor 2 family protein [Elusimicrobiota bacterium]|nr:nuclear transport factor 2 family protein [Elusimicrobiota bacterium]
MSINKQTVERYMAAYRRLDHPAVLACLTDDVVWYVPGAFTKRGKAEFDKEIDGDGCFEGKPDINVTRLSEEDGVVVAEGTVLTHKKGGEPVRLAFCDVFELRGGLISKLTSYLVSL